ncbi:MAG: peptidylprolyl isomerase [Oscillospiraceae bacterium]
MKKRILAAMTAAAALAGTLVLSGCTFTSSNYNAMQDYDFSSIELVQLEPPEDGDIIAIFETDLGEFRAVLYDEYCPNTVAKFIERAEAGQYDNLPVYAVVQDTYFLTGGHENEKGVYTGRDSDTEALEHEYNVNLWPFQGALITYSELPGYSDARYIVCDNDDTMTQEQIDELKNSMMSSDARTDVEKANLNNLFDKFIEVGGVFGMSGSVTVFGQTYEGIDVIEKITALQADEKSYRPYDTVMVKSVTISTYDSSEAAVSEEQ